MDIALRYAARSDVGSVRPNNQDSGYAGAHLLVVADGMGGHAGGDVASSITVGALVHLDVAAKTPEATLADLEQAIDDARQDLVDRSVKDPELSGMGTTVTALLLVDNRLVMAHLGDSRAYLLRDGELTQVTTDHTFVQHLVDTGRISPEEAETHPQRNVVMRVLGDFDVDLTPDLSVREAKVGDRWMLCSDGLSGFVHHEELRATLTGVSNTSSCAESLLRQALGSGSTDNITVIIADIVAADQTAPEPDYQVVGAAAVEDLPELTEENPADPAPESTEVTVDTSSVVTDPPADADEADIEDPAPAPRRGRKIIYALVTVLVLAGIAVAGWAGYRWTQSQYYLGISNNDVAIFQGVSTSVGPLTLSHPVQYAGVSTDELPPFIVDRLEATIPEASLETARTHMKEILAEAETANGTSEPNATDPATTQPPTGTETPAPDGTP